MLGNSFGSFEIAFVTITTLITIVILLLRLVFKKCVFLWKSTLISYISFIILMLTRVACEHFRSGMVAFLSEMLCYIFSIILVMPASLVYSLFLSGIRTCPSAFDIFIMHTIGFLFYMIVIWGILKFIIIYKEPKAAEQKQGDNLENQTPQS